MSFEPQFGAGSTNDKGQTMKWLVFFAAAVASFTGCAHQGTVVIANRPTHLPVACSTQPVQLTILGDSLARGWGARDPHNAIAARVYAFVQAKHPGSTLTNLGAPGLTTDEIARTQAPHVRASACSLVVVIAGANDVQKYYTPQHFRSSYEALLRQIRERDPGCALIVMGMPDVALSRRIPWLMKPIVAALSERANASIARAAVEYDAAVVPLYSLSLKDAPKANALLSSDGIHPNDQGYLEMASATYPALNELVVGTLKR